MKYLGKIEDAKSVVTKEYVDDAISSIGGGSGGSYDDSELREELSRKADVDGVYPEMTVGMTRDMLGVGEGDEGEFLFRPTDGDGSIKDGFASIERIEGNSVVWNQIFKGVGFREEGIYSSFENGEYKIQGTYTGNRTYHVAYNFLHNDNLSWRAGHKYLILNAFSDSRIEFIYLFEGVGTPKEIYSDGIFTPDGNGTMLASYIRVSVTTGETLDITLKPMLFDLTRMFGAGNEPSTVEEFYQRIPKGIDINAYNEGEVINMNVEGIKCVGFNAFNGTIEQGTINDSDGVLGDAVAITRTSIIKVLPNTNYYASISDANCYIKGFFYRNDGSFISAGALDAKGSNAFTTPSDASLMRVRFYRASDDLTVENTPKLCIHLVHTGYRNGDYEPYVSDEIALPIADYFPNGMNSIGDVKDELTATEAIQRIGVVDMGTLNWGLANTMFYVGDSIFFEGQKLLCAKYIHRAGYNEDKEIYSVGGVLRVIDLDYTDTASFKAAMSGVMLYYELAEPIVTSIDKPLALDYQVWDFGTEEAIAEGKTTPLKASIVYEFNARDTIRKNRNDIAKLNEELLQLKTNIGAGPYVLNATILDLNRSIQYYEGEQNITDLAEIRNALVNHRTIHIKYGSNFDGYFVVSGYIDGTDTITLEFWYGLTHYSIDIEPTTQIGYVSRYNIV